MTGFCKICKKPLPVGRRTLCSDECQRIAYSRQRARDRDAEVAADEYLQCCKYNNGVDCEDTTACDGCGWNPVVSGDRLARYWEVAGCRN